VFWLSDTDAPNGFSITFHNIAMHAISRDPESFPHSCIYMQIDTGELYESDEEEEEEGQEIITELRIVPSTDESRTFLQPTQRSCLMCKCPPKYYPLKNIKDKKCEHTFSILKFE
jgi:hypothetical protein